MDLKGVNDQVAASTPKAGSEQYPISPLALLATFGVIAGYLLFVYLMSFREYKRGHPRAVRAARLAPDPERCSVIVHVAEYLAWIISAGLGAWMVFDAVKVSREHSEEFLTTSVEGTDELLPPPAAGQPLDASKEERP